MYLAAGRPKSKHNFSVELLGKPGQIRLKAYQVITNIVTWSVHFLVVWGVLQNYPFPEVKQGPLVYLFHSGLILYNEGWADFLHGGSDNKYVRLCSHTISVVTSQLCCVMQKQPLL